MKTGRENRLSNLLLNKKRHYERNKRSDGKAILFNLVWSIVAIIINFAINFFVVPYVTDNIGIEAYGFVSLSNTFTSYVEVITIALNSFVARYITIAYHRNEYDKANVYFSSTIIANIVLSISVFIPSSLLISKLEHFISIPGDLTQDVKILFLLVLANHLITTLQTAFNVSVFITNKLDLQTRKKCISFIIRAVILFALCYLFKPHVWYVGVASTFMILYLFYQNYLFTRVLTPEFKFSWKNVSFQSIKELFFSGMWNSINNLGNILNSGLDLLISNLMLSPLAMGQVSVGKDLAVMCHTLIITIANTFRPTQARLYAIGEKEKLVRNLKLSMKITGMISGIIISVFFVYGAPFVRLWLQGREDFELIFNLTLIALASDVAVGVVSPLYYVYTLTNKLKIPSFITIGMGLLNVISMYLLLKYSSLGVYAVVLTTLILNCVNYIDAPLYSAYCLKVPLKTFYPEIFKHVLSIIANIMIIYPFKKILFITNSWMALIVNCSCCGAICLVITSLIVLNKEEYFLIIRRIFKKV